MRKQFDNLRELGLSRADIYLIEAGQDDYRDYVDECDYGYFESDRFYDEEGVSIRKGRGYIPSRFAA